ncbi:MAG TPA: LysM peptidoglycan-binding domain-containing protein [Candidatus Brocadiia bacterium]|nr:LysM peptidoglycan-binding domain-containing protein [Planctomycetota bacterium]MBI4007912.1 LysM peptidoglycan-binding domain-containing protein [Planctomycetota bacterium]MDO8094606.1 LysM peptidoglycan-binding domain-containing protein [Candidatus Brocadiales bacterium]
MRRDTEIGIIIGVVLAIIIGVFISTRTGVKEPTIPLSHTYEGKQPENEAPDLGTLTQQPLPEIAELPEERPEEAVPVTPVQADVQKEEGEEEEEVVEGEWEEVEQPPTAVIEEITPATKPAPAEAKEPEAAIYAGENAVYKVKANDTLAKLAKQYYGDEAKWTLIYNANAGKIPHRNALYVGQEIVIPQVSAPASGHPAEKPTAVERLPSPLIQAPVTPKETSNRTHTVQKGDTLFKLARQYYNNEAEWKKIYDANKNTIPNPNALSQGVVLIIPE